MQIEYSELLNELKKLYDAEKRKLQGIKLSEANAQIARVRAIADVIDYIILRSAYMTSCARWRICLIGKKLYPVCSKCGTVHFSGQLPKHCNGCGAKML